MIKKFTKLSAVILFLVSPIFSFAQTLTYASGAWTPFAPSASTGTNDVIIDDINCDMPHSSVVNNMTINPGKSVSILANPVTILGDLTMGTQASYAIGLDGAYLTVNGTTTISTQGSSSDQQYNVWSSPFTDGTLDIISSLSIVNPCDIYCFESTTQTWKFDYSNPFTTTCLGNSVTFGTNDVINITDGTADGNFDLGRGYFAPGVSPSVRVFSSNSNPNSGVINVPLYGSSVAVAGGNDWNLIGNPYISSIGAGSTIQMNSSLINAIYLYSAGTGAYITYNSTQSSKISTCQGFFVDANTVVDGFIGNFTFKNSLRRASNANFRGNSSTEIVYLSLTDNDSLNDQIQILLDPDCLDSYDRKFDARKLLNDHRLNFGSLITIDSLFGPEVCVFNGLKKLENKETKTVPLFIETPSAGTYEIKMDSLVNVPSGISLQIEDLELNVIKDLRTENLSFTTTKDDTLTSRFVLHINYDASITSVQDDYINSSLTVFVNNSNIELRSLKSDNSISTIQIYDVIGRLIYSEETKRNNATISLNKTGTFIVKATDSLGQVITKKVIL